MRATGTPWKLHTLTSKCLTLATTIPVLEYVAAFPEPLRKGVTSNGVNTLAMGPVNTGPRQTYSVSQPTNGQATSGSSAGQNGSLASRGGRPWAARAALQSSLGWPLTQAASNSRQGLERWV